jgi:hypothetical protein
MHKSPSREPNSLLMMLVWLGEDDCDQTLGPECQELCHGTVHAPEANLLSSFTAPVQKPLPSQTWLRVLVDLGRGRGERRDAYSITRGIFSDVSSVRGSVTRKGKESEDQRKSIHIFKSRKHVCFLTKASSLTYELI